LSLTELWYERAVMRRRWQQEADAALIQAWHLEWLRIRVEKEKQLPALLELLKQRERERNRQGAARRLQTPQEQVAILAAHGLRVRPRMNVRIKGQNA
jgi:hypothetical protein